MGYLETSKTKEIIELLKRYSTLKIYCTNNCHSISSVHILISILKRELIKFEVNIVTSHSDFPKENTEFKIIIDIPVNVNYECIGIGKVIGDENMIILKCEYSECSCDIKYTDSLQTMYSFAQKMNYLNNSILWNSLVIFNFYKIYFYEKVRNFDFSEKENYYEDYDEDSSYESAHDIENEMLCLVCKNFYKELIIEIKKTNQKNSLEKIFYLRKVDIPFIESNNIFESLSFFLDFILVKKLYLKSNIFKDYKIYEFLAKLGISIKESKDCSSNMTERSQNLIKENINQNYIYEYKFNYDFKISLLESFYVLTSTMYTSKPLYSIFCFSNPKYIDVNSVFNFYKSINYLLRINIHRLKQVGPFRLLSIPYLNNEILENYDNLSWIKIFHDLIKIFLQKSKRANLEIIILIEKYKETQSLLYLPNKKKKYLLRNIENESLDIENTIFIVKNGLLKYFFENLFGINYS
ncbi:hypothetical protein CWI39_2282p0010 [Hamiltosporidium magnivora]|uniref:Uncharacterized protein n=1 Tax=Hamiltosporidium magnivora TaxID=148818 RepID=A0A4Q9KV88_9MICR|nr:hypothetical protein CWI39_2282p0010 [Hamiltosporidium magnivora]